MPQGLTDKSMHAHGRLGRLGAADVLAVLRQLPGLWLIPGVFFIAASFGGVATKGPILCLFRLVSGIPCAGCGMTRAFVAIGHGQVDAAMVYNPLSPATWLWMTAWWLVAVFFLARGRAVPAHPGWLLKIGLFTLGGWWSLRAILFLLAPNAWQNMVEVSPLMRGLNALL
mgnify:CR=1 FL=1